MNKPLFTQKHYEYLEQELSRHTLDLKTLSVLADILEQDNPNFRRGAFMRRAGKTTNGEEK